MDDEVRSEAEELARAAQALVDGSQDLAGATRHFKSNADLYRDDLGNVEQAQALFQAHNKALAEAGSALERLVTVIEEGADNLLQTASFYRQADDAAQNRLQGVGRNGEAR